MEDILEVYKQPYDPRYPVICMDESSKQLTKEVRSPIKASSGSVEKYDTEYERNGTCNIFLSFEPLKGYRDVRITNRRTKIDWANYIRGIIDSDQYKKAKKIKLVSDNLNTHNESSFYEAFSPSEARRIIEKIEFHYTPKHGSWLNMAEIELSHLSRQCLDRRIPDMKTIKEETRQWNKDRNENKVVANWRFTTKDARIKLRKLYPDIVDNRGQN